MYSKSKTSFADSISDVPTIFLHLTNFIFTLYLFYVRGQAKNIIGRVKKKQSPTLNSWYKLAGSQAEKPFPPVQALYQGRGNTDHTH